MIFLTLGVIGTTTALLIAGGIAAASAGTSYYAARQQNKAIEKAGKAQAAATAAQQRQLVSASALERRKILRESQQLEGRLRVAAGEAGIGSGGTSQALQRQNLFDTGANLAILQQNLTNRLAYVRSGYQASAAELSARGQNELLAGVGGGLSGFSTGLSIGTGLQGLGTTGGVQ